MTEYHDIHVHYGKTVNVILNIDGDVYCHMDMLNEVSELSLSQVPTGMGLEIKMFYFVPGTQVEMPLNNDENMLLMFEMYKGIKIVDIYIQVIDPLEEWNDDGIANGVDYSVGKDGVGSKNVNEVDECIYNDGKIQDNIKRVDEATYNHRLWAGTVNEAETIEKRHDEVVANSYKNRIGKQIIVEDGYEEDDIYGLSSEDDDFQCDNEEEHASDFEIDNDEFVNEKLVNEVMTNNDGLSDYSSSDECNRVYYDENDDDEKDNQFVEDGQAIEGRQVDCGQLGKVFDHYRYGKEFVNVKKKKIKLCEGLLFSNVQSFRQVLRDFTIQEGFKIERIKNEKKRVTCKCAAVGCPWRIHASPLPDKVTYKIKTYCGTHTCIVVSTNTEATSTWIANKLGDTLRDNPDMKINEIQTKVRKKWQIECNKMQLYRAKKKALAELDGCHVESYKSLRQYGQQILSTNPGSIVDINTDRLSIDVNPTFKRMFIAYEALTSGFRNACRPFIGVDGCHLKGPYGGVLLAAVALDGNNGLFPVAIAVVETECKQSWKFFFSNLRTALSADDETLTFISDMQKGLKYALNEEFPYALHRTCARHLFCNFRKKYPTLLLKNHFWRAVRAYNEHDFNLAMDDIKKESQSAYNYLMKEPLETWTRYGFDERCKSDHVTSNFCESFNHWVDAMRGRPILKMLEGISCKLMQRIQTRYENGCAWDGYVTPNIRKKLNLNLGKARICRVIYGGGNKFKVVDDGFTFLVDIGLRVCDCRAWQVSGIPCKHGVAAIASRRANVEQYCDAYFTNHAYLVAHGKMIHPTKDQRLWKYIEDGSDPLDPPPLHRLPGRPKKNRRKEPGEVNAGNNFVKRALSVKCSNCKQFGHNRLTCQRDPPELTGNAVTQDGVTQVVGEGQTQQVGKDQSEPLGRRGNVRKKRKGVNRRNNEEVVTELGEGETLNENGRSLGRCQQVLSTNMGTNNSSKEKGIRFQGRGKLMTRSKRDGSLVYPTNNGNPVSKTGAHWVDITPPNQVNKRTIHSIGSKGGLVAERKRSCGNQTAENHASIVNQTQSHTAGNHTQVTYVQFPIRNQIDDNL